MIDKLALQLTSFICIDAYDNPKDRARIQYGLSIFLSEGFKIVSLILLFNFIHYEKYFYFSLLILMSIRVFAGGVHVKGTLNCLILTIMLFMCTSVLAPSLPRLPIVCYLFVGTFGLVTVLVRAPICSVRSPIKDAKKKLQYKLTAALFVLFWTILLLFLDSTYYINCGFCTILMQNTQLLLVKKKLRPN
ncbi:accessory gene regulator B family protein [Candidatus Clostridium stratigraminis]|uniref:Accessory gene regulator B family protein n=1 Tax=Candidatus Clostridium stratigraminis TaxID=3381661 RepID=A0ABW8T148_9CLOT